MEPNSSLNHDTPPDSNGLYHCGYGGAITSDHPTSRQHYTGRKKSKVRLNDQLIPKPTDINMLEKMIKTATPKEHPYSSHISQFAMFPSFRSPDDPQTGVRAASQPFLNPLIPNSAPEVTLLSKTMGNPYRHEILEAKTNREKKALIWTGERGFSEYTKPLKENSQVFYPTLPKKVLPNSKLRDWDLSLSERTCNMLKNLERAHWVTSYQMHYTGSGPTNPLKIDDFNEKISDLTGMNSHSAPLRERSFPVFVPSKPIKVCRRRQGSHVGEGNYSSTAAEHLNLSPASAHVIRHRPEDTIAEHTDAPDPNPKEHSLSKYSFGSSEAQGPERSQEVLHQQQTESKSFAHDGRKRENCKVHFNESPIQVSVPQSSKEANATWIADTEQPLNLDYHPISQGEMEVNEEKSVTERCAKDGPSRKKEYFKGERNVASLTQSGVAKGMTRIESHAELLSKEASEQEAKGRQLLCSISNPCILPRPPALPGIRPADKMWAVGREDAALSLLDLQKSFNKSMAHHNVNSSISHATVNLRDNVVTGKKHDFYGINCCYLHG